MAEAEPNDDTPAEQPEQRPVAHQSKASLAGGGGILHATPTVTSPADSGEETPVGQDATVYGVAATAQADANPGEVAAEELPPGRGAAPAPPLFGTGPETTGAPMGSENEPTVYEFEGRGQLHFGGGAEVEFVPAEEEVLTPDSAALRLEAFAPEVIVTTHQRDVPVSANILDPATGEGGSPVVAARLRAIDDVRRTIEDFVGRQPEDTWARVAAHGLLGSLDGLQDWVVREGEREPDGVAQRILGRLARAYEELHPMVRLGVDYGITTAVNALLRRFGMPM